MKKKYYKMIIKQLDEQLIDAHENNKQLAVELIATDHMGQLLGVFIDDQGSKWDIYSNAKPVRHE